MGNTTATVTTRATEAAKWFTTTKRGDETITVLKEGRPDWVQALAFAAHGKGDMLPDDYRYATISEAVDAIAEAEDLDEAESEFESDTDDYTNALTGWLHSRTDRYGFVDEAREEWGARKVDSRRPQERAKPRAPRNLRPGPRVPRGARGRRQHRKRVIPESRTFELRPVELRFIVRRLVKHLPAPAFRQALHDLHWPEPDGSDLAQAVDEAYNAVCKPDRRF